jgi:hypothetical protein
VPGEVTWRVPSLSIADEAVALFADRACRARPEFEITEENTVTVREICERLDGMPLAIELAAARVRALSITEISAGLHDRFRLLTGGARTLMPRQQTLLASVDWSHALLSDAERILFRRLAVFVGGFNLAAAHAVAGGDDVDQFQVLDELTMLVDKSLVIAEDSHQHTRYRLLETVRQYAMEQLELSGEVQAIRNRHRDHYTAVMDVIGTRALANTQLTSELAALDLENLRTALALRADDEPDPELLIRGSRNAAWLLDYPLADRLADAGIRAGAGTEATHLRAFFLLTLGRGREADALLTSVEGPESTAADRANTAFLRAVNLLYVLADPTAAKELIDNAAQSIPDTAWSGLYAFRALYWAALGKPAAALESSQTIVWDQLPDVAARMTAWAITVAYGDSGRTNEAATAAESGYLIPARPWFVNLSDANVGALLFAGQIAAAHQVAERLSRRAVGFPNPQLTSISTALEGRTALASGRLVSASYLLGQASEKLAAAGDTHGWGYRVELSRTTALAMRGLTDKATDSLQRLEMLRHPSWRYLDWEWAIAHSWVSACQGALDDAIAASLSGAQTARANGQVAAEVMCLQTATQFGDRSTAARLHELAGVVSGPRAGLAARFAAALNAGDAAELAAVSEQFERIGDVVAAVDAGAHAAAAYGQTETASTCATRAHSLAQAGSISTPALRLVPG